MAILLSSKTQNSSPHGTGINTVSKIMFTLLAALAPGGTCLVYYFSWGYGINLVLAVVTALVVEALVLKVRRRPILFFLKDGSAIVTAAL